MQATWLPAVAAYDRVPATNHVAVISIEHLIGNSKLSRPALRHVITAPAIVSGLIRAANRLPGLLPGARNCPDDNGIRAVITFATSPTTEPNRTLVAGFCDIVSVTSPGHPTAGLSDTPTFSKLYRQLLPPGSLDGSEP